MSISLLPPPDAFGNIWLNPNHKEGPAIFPHKVLMVNQNSRISEAKFTGKFSALASRGRFLEDAHGERRFFDSPADALFALTEEGL